MANKITGVAAALTQLPADLMKEVVTRFDVLAKESASRVVGGGATMNMHTRRGRVPVKMGTRSNQSGEGRVFINGEPSAQWVWIESGTKAHTEGRRGGFVKGPRYSHPMRAPVAHPGSRGQGAWSRAVDEFRSEYADIAIDVLKAKVK